MNSSGISRRIDELGRIVIPIEIRRLLNIKVGDNLEFIINSDSVCIKKNNIIDNNTEFLRYIFKSIESFIDGDILIANREKVILSSDNTKMGLNVTNFLDIYDDFEVDGKEMGVKGLIYVFPFIVDNIVSGFIILYNTLNIDKYKLVMKFICSYIQNKLTLS